MRHHPARTKIHQMRMQVLKTLPKAAVDRLGDGLLKLADRLDAEADMHQKKIEEMEDPSFLATHFSDILRDTFAAIKPGSHKAINPLYESRRIWLTLMKNYAPDTPRPVVERIAAQSATLGLGEFCGARYN